MRKQLKTNELTRAELEIMQIVWKLDKCFLGEIVEACEEPKPAYTTVASTLNVLVTKGYVTYKTWNKSNQYYAVLQKEDYAGKVIRHTLSRFFNNSPSQMLSFLNDSQTLTEDEYDELKDIARQILDKETK